MSVRRKKIAIEKATRKGWESLIANLPRMSGGCDVKPTAADQAFSFDRAPDEDAIKIVVNPIVFLLKERANATKAALYVTVSGKLNFSVDDEALLACYYSTQVAYFRMGARGSVDHVFGVHYDKDMRNVPGHPVFHGQLKSFANDCHHIASAYHQEVTLRSDKMDGVFSRIRVPTPHMDPMSVFLQLMGDHLIDANTAPEGFEAFRALRRDLSFFRSDLRRCEPLEDVFSQHCLRGDHWYQHASAARP